MEGFLLGALCVAVIVIAVLATVTIVVVRRSDRRYRSMTTKKIATSCIACQGRGHIIDQQRTLDFDGEGFRDGAPRTRRCPACAGTGVVHR